MMKKNKKLKNRTVWRFDFNLVGVMLLLSLFLLSLLSRVGLEELLPYMFGIGLFSLMLVKTEEVV